MMSQKTTSFSKILASKTTNNHQYMNLNSVVNGPTSQMAPSPPTSSSSSSGLLNTTDTSQQQQKDPKTTEYNTSNSTTTSLEHYDEEEEAYEEDVDDDVNNLEFSDHAGLFTSNHRSISELVNEHDSIVMDEDEDDEDRHRLTNYDIYKLTKKNYKLTFNKSNNSPHFAHKTTHKEPSIRSANNNNNNNNTKTNNIGSNTNNNTNKRQHLLSMMAPIDLNHNQVRYSNTSTSTSTCLKQQQIAVRNTTTESNEEEYEERNDDDYEEDEDVNQEEDEEEEDDEDEEDYEEDEENYMYEGAGQVEASLNESIMNWSMKISNYGSDIVGGNNKYRSQSRSPPPMPPSSHSGRQASQKNNSSQPVKSSVTSWGQVKHSKSSSSHLGSPLETSRCDYGTQTSPVQICTATIPGASHQLASPTQQPLYKLFQTSRSNMTDASLTRSSRRDTLDEQHQNLLVSPPQNRTQNNSNNLKSESRTTSFSQIRQRSVSSYVLGSNSTTITTVTGIDTENNKQQSKPVKKSVGIQHPPPKCDQSMQTPARTTTESPSTIVCMLVGPPKHLLTNREELIRCARLAVRQATAVQAKRSQSLTVNQASVKKASLPDLTFLNDYSSTPPAKTVTNKTVDQSTTTVSSSTTGGELLKRKTLKSIKRYRQTKQNTEPCGLLLAAQHTQMAQQTLHQQYFTQHTQILPDNHLSLAPTSPDLAKKQLSKKYNNNSNKSTTKHRQSPPVNNTTSNERTPVENSTSSTSSSITSPTPRPRSLGAKKHQQQQSPGHKNVPYPPPLPPPHHNHHHASNLQRQTSLPGYTKPPQPTSSNKQPLKSCLKRKESSSTVPTPTTNTNTTKRIEAEVEQTTTINPKAASMFVPYVGYLFTCDQGSCTRYCYYNGLEKRRKMKLYKQLTSSARATNNRRHLRQDENSEEEDDEEDEEDEIDDDEEDEEEELKSSGEKEALTETSKTRVTVTNSSIVTNTYKSENDLRSLAKKQVKFSNSSNQANTERTVEAPPLQYDTLIAMLKSRKPSAPQNKPTAPPPPLPPQQSPQFIKKRVSKPHQAPAVPIPTASVSKTFHHHHHMAIEADSISLASLSESPPSEFKFSDEEMDHDEEDDHEEDQVAAAALVLNEMAAIQSQVLMSKHGAQLVDYSKSIQIQQQRIAQLAEIRNKKKVFHNVLLNDQKLNNLKEILVEIKQQQHQNTNTTSNNSSSSSTSSASSASSNNNTSSTSSSSSSSSASSSALHQPQTTTNSIERLCQYLFDILKQSLKPIDTTLGLIRSTSASQSQEQLSSTLGQKQMSLAAATESNHVALSYSQYTQLWMLIEQTISSILSGNGPTNGGKFNLPREAIVNMFQEINRYSMLTNQTYLIDGVNSSPSATLGSNASMNTTAANSHQSQLRRKHHYMVMLMGLKFKFQLFIVNLLNHKQLSNWFDLLNRDRQLLKVYYDFKYTSSMSANQTNTSGDSGVSSEFMYASHCSSTNANSCSISSNISTQANHHLYELTSLANVSIFEHDEYYSYFHKLLQQFQHVDFHIKLNATCGPPTATITTTPSPTQTPTATQPKLPSTIKQGKIPHSNTTTIYQNSQPNSSGGSSNSSSGGSSSTFNLKSISKRLNIKSWFTSSSSMVNQTPPTKIHHNHHHHNSSATTRLTNFTQQHKHKMSVAEKSGHLGAGVGCLLAHHNSAMTSNPIYSKPPPPSNHRHHNTTTTNESLMKHSLSEPSLNSIINMS